MITTLTWLDYTQLYTVIYHISDKNAQKSRKKHSDSIFKNIVYNTEEVFSYIAVRIIETQEGMTWQWCPWKIKTQDAWTPLELEWLIPRQCMCIYDNIAELSFECQRSRGDNSRVQLMTLHQTNKHTLITIAITGSCQLYWLISATLYNDWMITLGSQYKLVLFELPEFLPITTYIHIHVQKTADLFGKPRNTRTFWGWVVECFGDGSEELSTPHLNLFTSEHEILSIRWKFQS